MTVQNILDYEIKSFTLFAAQSDANIQNLSQLVLKYLYIVLAMIFGVE